MKMNYNKKFYKKEDLLEEILQDPVHWDLADAFGAPRPNGDQKLRDLSHFSTVEVEWVLEEIRKRIYRGIRDAKEMTKV